MEKLMGLVFSFVMGVFVINFAVYETKKVGG